MIENLIPVVITPFTENGKIYEKGLENLYKHLSKYNIEYIFSGGSYAGFALLDVSTRISLGKISNRIAKSYGIESIFNVGSSSPDETLRIINELRDEEINALALVAPYYYSNNGTYEVKDIINYVSYVVDHSDKPLYFYNNPKTTGMDLSPEDLQLLADSTGIAGIKDSNEDFKKILGVSNLKIGNPNADVPYLPGTTASMLFAANLGMRQCMSGIFLSFPELIGDLFLSAGRGETARSMALYKKAMLVRDVMGKYAPRAISAYYILNHRGVDVGVPKFPWPQLSAAEQRALIADIESLDVIQ